MRNMKTLLPLLLMVAVTFAVARAQAPATTTSTAPATSPATGPASKPATAPTTTQASQPAVDPAAVKILDALEAAGVKHKTIQTDINYKVKAGGGLGDVEIRTGFVMYQKDNPDDFTRFRIHFETLKQNEGRAIREQKDYAFAPDKFKSQWLSIADYTNKILQQKQVAVPGQKIQPLKIGEGPFPIPFGQKTKDVLNCCDVSTRAPQDGDPKDTDYLKLTPKPKFKKDLNFVELQMWVDRKLGLPVKVVSKEANKAVTTVDFDRDKIKINEKIDPSNFLLERKLGWKIETTTLEKKQE